MKKAPYTLQEAEQICRDYQYLAGQKFSPESDLIIECVTITPFDQVNKKRFLIFYFLFNNAESALAHEYKGFVYDIIVIGRSQRDEHELLQEDLYVWLSENKTNVRSDAKTPDELPAAVATGSN